MSFPSSEGRRKEGRRAPPRPGLGRTGGTAAFNTLVTCVLIAVLISTGMTYYFRVVRAARETALRYELVNLRTAILLFAAVNRRFPGNLQELVAGSYLLPNAEFSISEGGIGFESRSIMKRAFLEPNSVDSEGRILDPFGYPYRYDQQHGRVSSADARYVNW